MNPQKKFHLILVRPTRYDDDGYPVHWRQTPVPSNSLACMYGIAMDCRARAILGNEVEITIEAVDESNNALQAQEMIQKIKLHGGHGLLALVGVQSNQFPRAMDLASLFVAEKIPVCIGGYHVSGCLAMFSEPPPDLKNAMAKGISLFAGEAEERRFDQVLIDAWQGKLKTIYDYSNQLVELSNQPLPFVPQELVQSSVLTMSSIDLGRGCPFSCSFCCIINVHGQKSRFRTVEDLERIVRLNFEMGTKTIFITDDNFSRNRNWEVFLDKLIELRKDGIVMSYFIQVDVACHRIARFIDKAAMAGIDQIFVGLETINPANLSSIQKKQNNILEYQKMMLAWKKYPIVITAGYIIGLPHDTKESISKDIETIKQRLPIDILNVSILTPLPGSVDHKNLVDAGVQMDADLNKYDLNHRITHHAKMSDAELDNAYEMAWDAFYTPAHMETVLRRMIALGSNKRFTTLERLIYFGVIGRVHGIRSYEASLKRIKNRRDRRPGLPLESFFVFYPKYFFQTFKASFIISFSYYRLYSKMRKMMNDPEKMAYRDLAITPTSQEEIMQSEVLRRIGISTA